MHCTAAPDLHACFPPGLGVLQGRVRSEASLYALHVTRAREDLCSAERAHCLWLGFSLAIQHGSPDTTQKVEVADFRGKAAPRGPVGALVSHHCGVLHPWNCPRGTSSGSPSQPHGGQQRQPSVCAPSANTQAHPSVRSRVPLPSRNGHSNPVSKT